MTPNSITAGKAVITIAADDKNLSSGLNKSRKALQSFQDSCTKILTNLYNSFYLLRDAIQPIAQTFSEFDDQMRLTSAVTSATSTQFASLTARAKTLGATTAFTAKQVAEGMTSLGRMGFSSDEINAAIPAVMDLSRATGTDLAQASDIAANTLRIFGLEASKMSTAADILTATANGSAQTLADLFEALKMAGPQASAAKESITDVSAAIGIMANVGIKGSMAGTALRRAYINMANPQIQAYLDKFNIKTVDTSGNMRRMRDILYEVAQAMKTMGTAEKMAFAEEVFDMRGSFVGLSLGGNIEGLDSFMQKLEECGGISSRTAKEMEGGLGGSIRSLSSAFEGLIISIGNVSSGFLTDLMKSSTNLLRNLTEVIENMPGLSSIISEVGGVAVYAAVGLFSFAASGSIIAHTITSAAAAMTKLYAASMWLFANPATVVIGLLLAAVSAVAAHIIKLNALNKELEKASKNTAKLKSELEGLTSKVAKETADIGGKWDELNMLAKVSQARKLSNEEILRGSQLLKDFSKIGLVNIATLDATAGTLTLAADAARDFNYEMEKRSLAGLEDKKKKINEIIASLKEEQRIKEAAAGSRALGKRLGIQAEYQGKMKAYYDELLAIEAKIDAINNKKLTPPAPAAANSGPTYTQEIKAKAELARLDEELDNAFKTASQRKVSELTKQNELYQEQLELLKQRSWMEADSKRAEIKKLEEAKQFAYNGTAEERRAAEKAARAARDFANEKLADAKKDRYYLTGKEQASVLAGDDSLFMDAGKQKEAESLKAAIAAAASANAAFDKLAFTGVDGKLKASIKAQEKAVADMEAQRAKTESERNAVAAGQKTGDLGALDYQLGMQQAAIDKQVKSLDALIAEASKQADAGISAGLDRQIAEAEKELGKLDERVESLVKKGEARQAEYERNVARISDKEVSDIFAGLDNDTASRRAGREQQDRRDYFSSALEGGAGFDFAGAIAAATAMLNDEADNEAALRAQMEAIRNNDESALRELFKDFDTTGMTENEIAAASEQRKLDTLKALAEQVRRSMEEQDFMSGEIARVNTAQENAETSAPDTGMASFYPKNRQIVARNI